MTRERGIVTPLRQARSDERRNRSLRLMRDGGPMSGRRTRGQCAGPQALVARATLLLSLLLGFGCDCRGALVRQDAGQSDGGQADSSTDGGQDGGQVQNCLSSNPGSYAGVLMDSQTGAFEIVFEVTPQASPIEAAVALSQGLLTVLGWGDNAAIVRFNVAGTIDARSGTCQRK